MDKFRAWVYARQGLADRRFGSAPEALAGAGWSRSVGGVNPYLAIRARSGEGRAQVDALTAELKLFELPTARGCTYVVPADHFAAGLAVGQGFGSASDMALARKLGVEESEINALKEAVASALTAGSLSPADLKTALGSRVRNLGEDGKKRGMTTTLPLAIGLLQSEGRVRRKPTNGRLDTQRYDYELWEPALVLPEHEEALAAVARLFFLWTGAASMKDFREFTALTLKSCRAACEQAGIVEFEPGSDLLCLPEAPGEFAHFEASAEPAVRMVGNLDSFLHLRRSGAIWLHDEDRSRLAPTDKGLTAMSGLAELWSHAILDRGRLIGLWEFDADDGSIVWCSWSGAADALREAVDATQSYICENLGDARSFSLDSPASRRPRLDALRVMASV